MSKVILDLCGGTGSWAKPYKDAGFDVRTITLPDHDVLNWRADTLITEPIQRGGVYGILAAPPCTMFSHARTKAVAPRDLKGAMDIVRACLEIVAECQYNTDTGRKITSLKFWALENPWQGLLPKFLGRPAFIFDPYEFGDGYKKRTAIWGNFNDPIKSPGPMTGAKGRNHEKLTKFDYLKTKDIYPEYYGIYDRTVRRSITPPGFAKAFYEANK